MFDLIKKTLLTGVGLAVLTKEKVEEVAEELVQKGKLSEREGQALIDDLLKRSEQARRDLEAKIEGAVQQAVAKLDVATKEDVSQLIARIERLEQRVADQEQ